MKMFKSLCTTYALEKDYIDVLADDTEHSKYTFIVNASSSNADQAKK